MTDDADELRRRLDRLTGPARTSTLVELSRVLTDRYWRAGPGRAEALTDLNGAIGALTEAYGYFAGDDGMRAPVAVQLGSLLAARHVAHGGPDGDRETGIERLAGALGSPRLSPGQAVLGRLMLGQLYLSRALGRLRTGGILPALRPGGGSQVEAARRAAECFRRVLAEPELSPQVTTGAQTLLTVAEGIVEAFRGVGVDVGAMTRAVQTLRRLQKQGHDLGMGSLFTAGTRMARMDPLDRPVVLIEAAEEPVRTTTTAGPAPAPAPEDPRLALRRLLGDEPSVLPARPDVATADESVALAVTVLHGGPADAADHLLLALALTLRSRTDDGPGADDDAAGARAALRTAASGDLPPEAFPLLLRLAHTLGEEHPADGVTAALRTAGADALAVPQPDGMLLLHAGTGQVSLGTERTLPRRTLIVTDRPRVTGAAVVSTLASHRQLLDLARRRRRPIIEEPVVLAGPEGAELRRCYGRGELLHQATAGDVLARLGATVLHLGCPAGPAGTLLLAGRSELTAEAVAGARIRRSGGLVVLPPGAAFPALADAFLTAGFTGAVGWLRPVEPAAAVEVYRELHRRLGQERQEPASAVHAVRRQLRDVARGLAHRGVY